MKEKWEELLRVLSSILSIYQSILELSQQKTQILVSAKAQDLEEVTRQEEVLLLQVRKLEGLRGKLVGELMAAYGIKGQNLSLIELSKIAEPQIAKELDEFSQELKTIMVELVPLNKLNTELVEQALDFINYNVNLLSQTVAGGTYAAKGQTNEQKGKRTVFDARV